MARYPLEPLLNARIYREDAAAREALQAKRRLEEAEEAERAALREWRDYGEWRPGEEARLFEILRGNTVPQSELDRHRDDIQALRRAELDLEEAHREAQKSVAVRAAELEEAKRRQAEAARDRRKIDAHRDIWRREEALRVEKAEEAELEDFGGHAEED